MFGLGGGKKEEKKDDEDGDDNKEDEARREFVDLKYGPLLSSFFWRGVKSMGPYWFLHGT